MSGPKICLFGASPDTGNLGVSALCFSALRGLYRKLENLQVTVFDETGRVRRLPFRADGKTYTVGHCGGYLSRRVWHHKSLWNIWCSSCFGGLGNPGARALEESDVVLDASGGDSFTDLYGAKRFRGVTLTKRMALSRGKPLILLPQTYGPFLSQRAFSAAAELVQRAEMAWARDEASYQRLQELLGSRYDPVRHRCGVDMAFGLESAEPTLSARESLAEWLDGERLPTVSFNVSGLIFNRATDAARQYRLRADYRQIVVRCLERLLAQGDCRILLIPHVVTPSGHFEADTDACHSVAKTLGDKAKGRLMVFPAILDPRHAKWGIVQADWFCGTRMHSTIAALSSGVPSVGIAYSDKMLGVFESCGQGDCVVDLRQTNTDEAVERIWECWEHRHEAKGRLDAALPAVLGQAERQMDEIATKCSELARERAARQSCT
ncbi:MAG: polysaccharide pyruvyl transferase family protein [Planctomycetota bacterium]|nr:polysaccharide pyruvyl transferase family protein [Planctomycetota bacterium]